MQHEVSHIETEKMHYLGTKAIVISSTESVLHVDPQRAAFEQN
jgi:hypothetical protein